MLKRDIQKFLYQSEEARGGVITCLLAAMVGSAAFSIILSNRLPAINFLWLLDSQSVLIAAIAIVFIQVSILENSRSPLLSAVHGILITSTAIASYAVALKGYWIHPVYDSFSVGGLIPANDAAGWLQSAWHLLARNEIVGMGERRPLDTGLRALSLMAFGDFVSSIKFIVLICALTAVFFVSQVQKLFGWLAAIASFLVELVLIKDMLPLSMTETHGVIFGNIGFGMILIALRQRLVFPWLLGLAALSLGLNIRAGPLFLLLALWLWVLFKPRWLCIEGRYFRVLLMSGFMISSGFIVSLLVNQIWSSSSQIHSNFALHLYGLVSGGRGWEAALIDYPGLNSQQIMMFSLKMFFEKPSLFFSYYLGELYEFVRLFVRYEMGLSRVLFLVGVSWLLLTRKQVTSQLLLYSVCGIWLSAPFLMDDAGKRVFAVAYPVFGLLMGLATTALVKIVVSGPKVIAELADCAMIPRAVPEQDRLWIVVSAIACTVGFCSVPLIAGTQWRVPASNQVNATCPPTAIFIEENGLNSVRLEVLPDNQPVQRYPHEIQVSQFTQTIPNDGGDGSGGQVYELLHKETEPFALVMIYDVSNQKRRYVVDRNKTHISKGGSTRVLCIEKEDRPLQRSSK